MTPELIALGRRAVACPQWRWMPGMLRKLSESLPYVRPAEIAKGKWAIFLPENGSPDWDSSRAEEDGDPFQQVASRAAPDGRWIPYIPDLSDPATLGCLLSLVREAWGGDVWTQGAICYPTITSADNPPTRSTGRLRWVLGGLHRDSSLRLAGVEGYDSEAAALVVALEGAP